MSKPTFGRLRTAPAAEESAEGGFTLIELMVVLLIIAILLAVAIPTFLGVASSANDRAAQSNLTNALTEATAVYQSDNQSYTGTATALLGSLTSSAPEFSWTSGGCGPTRSNCISAHAFDVTTVGDAQGLVLADYSSTLSSCWYVLELAETPTLASPDGAFDNATGATRSGVWYAKSSQGSNSCTATDPLNGVNGFTSGAEYWFSTYSSVSTTG